MHNQQKMKIQAIVAVRRLLWEFAKTVANTLKMTKEEIEKEIGEIETAMACDDSISETSFTFANAEARLEYLYTILQQYGKS